MAQVWFAKNDMIAEVAGLRSSTMGSTAYLNLSTGLRVSVWEGFTTSTPALVSNRNLLYVGGSNGLYRAVLQTTETTKFAGLDTGLAVFVLNHSGLNAEWRVPFRVDNRRSS